MLRTFKPFRVTSIVLCCFMLFSVFYFNPGNTFAQDEEQVGINVGDQLGEGDIDPPGDGAEDPPGDGTEDPPGEGTEDPPGEGTEDPPGEGIEELPDEGTEEMPVSEAAPDAQSVASMGQKEDKFWNQNNVSAMYGPATAWGRSYNKLSDNDTSNSASVFNATTLENGRFWVDKSVNNDKAVIYDHDGTVKTEIEAAPDEFLITLSALSEAYSIDTVVPPVDAVFILDLSGSMTYNVANDNPGAVGSRRIDEMVKALNMAITMLMDANPANRVSVVGYGGLSGRAPKSYKILDLGYYRTSNGAGYFSVGATPTAPSGGASIENLHLNVNSTLTNGSTPVSPILGSAPVGGGTPTQKGIHEGAKVLMDNTDKTFTDLKGNTLPRKPVMILLTDGEPTFAWTDYIALSSKDGGADAVHTQDWGDALQADMGISLLTVATASYWKQQVSDWYYSTIDPGKTVEYYTIGLGPVTNMPHARAVLDPKTYASGSTNTVSGTTYNMGTLLNSFLGGGAINFPVRDKLLGTALSYTFSQETIQNNPTYIKNYFFPDRYFPASNAAALEDAFKTIAQQMITKATYITEVDDPRGTDYSGYLTFSDVLGQYMEFEGVVGLWFEGTKYDGATFSQNIPPTNPGGDGTWNGYATRLAAQIEKKQGNLDMTAADAIPLIENSIAAGIALGTKGEGLYYRGVSDYGNKISWYADDEKFYIAPYFNSAGAVAARPAGAKCRMDLYPIAGTVNNYVDGQPTDLLTVCLAVLTPLDDGKFYDVDNPAGIRINARSMKKEQQIVRWYIPASLLPMRTAVAEAGTAPGEVLRAEIKEAEPIRVVYSVGLQGSLDDPLDFATIDSAYRKAFRLTPAGKATTGYPARYHFYTNQDNVTDNRAMVFGEIHHENRFYYYYDPDNPGAARVPLYRSDGKGGYILAANNTNGTLYAKQQYFDENAQGYIGERYVSITKTNSKLDLRVVGGVATIKSGAVRDQASTGTTGKSKNVTTTRSYVTQISEVTTTGTGNPLVQMRRLGNNGRFYIPVTQVNVEKRWFGVRSEPIDVQLMVQPGAIGTSGAGVPFGPPVTLSSANKWKYSWYSNSSNRELFVYWPLYAASATNGDNVEFQNYSVTENIIPSGDYDVTYKQPVWNPSKNTWSLAVVNNGTPPPPTTTTPPDPSPPGSNNAGTGDAFDLLSWWMLLFTAALGLCLIYKAWEYNPRKRRRAYK